MKASSRELGSKEIMNLESTYAAHNYHPVPVVFARAEGAKVWDPEGTEYLDFLSAYSAVNQGHCHPRIVKALTHQAGILNLSSRAFYNDQFGPYSKFMTQLFGYDMLLPMNTGAEGVETALKLARKWGYMKKGIPENKAIILACEGNFHGRTLGIISMSSDPTATTNFGPFLPRVGYHHSDIGDETIFIRYGNTTDLSHALAHYGPQIAALLIEPIQGEAGVIVPPEGYLRTCYQLCKEHNVLFIADEVQTGLGRTGKMLAVEHEQIKPDLVILGKALGGGVYPVSAVLGNHEVMSCIQPGEHGSTFGGNPMACAVAREALQVILDEKLIEKAERLGVIFRDTVQGFNSPIVRQIRGKGLLNAVELDEAQMNGRTAWQLCLLLKEMGLLAKQTHGNIVRFAPPLVISESDLKKGLSIIQKALEELMRRPIEELGDG